MVRLVLLPFMYVYICSVGAGPLKLTDMASELMYKMANIEMLVKIVNSPPAAMFYQF